MRRAFEHHEVEVLLAAHPSHDQARAVLARYCLQAGYLTGDACDGEQRTAMRAMAIVFSVLLTALLLVTGILLLAGGSWIVDMAPGAAATLQRWVHSLSPGPLALMVSAAAASVVAACVATAVAYRATQELA